MLLYIWKAFSNDATLFVELIDEVFLIYSALVTMSLTVG